MMLGGVGMMAFWALIPIAIVALVVWAVVYFARSAERSNAATPQGESPFDVLRRRYAAGEINKEQFEEMKRVLGL
jgi:putative membrane protein